MTLRGKMNDGSRFMFAQQVCHRARITDVSAHKGVPGIVLEACQIGEVPGVGEEVEIHDRSASLLDPLEHEIGTNKSGSTCDKNRLGTCDHFS